MLFYDHFSNFNSILINFSALSQLYGTTTGHVHFMTRGGGGYVLVLIASLAYFFLYEQKLLFIKETDTFGHIVV